MMKNSIEQMGRMAFILIFIGCSFSISGFASKPENQKSIFDLMQHKEVLKVELETDMENLRNNRRFDEYQKASFAFKDKTGKEQSWDIKVRIRGNFRRLHCSEMPPLKLNFKKSDLREAGLAEFDDLKLVTHCISEQPEAYELVMREYLAYKMYNELTPNSFRVQLLRIIYKDSNTGKKTKQWAFLIEDTAQLKERTQSIDCDSCLNAGLEAFHTETVKLVSVFQYLIGNSDWDINAGRNLKLLTQKGKIIPVPYDFDFSGLVNAPYAIPNPNYDMKFVRDRIYLGFEQQVPQLHSILFYLDGKKENLLEIVRQFRYLSSDSKYDMIKYLNTYFDHMEDIQLAKRRPITRANPVSP